MAGWSGPCFSYILRRERLTSLKSSGSFFQHRSLQKLQGNYLVQLSWIYERREEEQFRQHLDVMLGEEAERPGWDLEGRFIPSNIQLYFEDKSQELVQVMIFLSPIHSFSLPHPSPSQVKLEASLGEAVCKRGFLLKGGTPAFIVLVKDAEFTNDFLSKYTIRNKIIACIYFDFIIR